MLSSGVPIAKLFLGLALGLTLHLGAMGLTGVLLGGTLKQVSLGFGPTVRRFRVRGAEVLLKLLPLGGYVQFWRSDDDPAAPPGVVHFDRLPGYRRALAQLAGPLALLAAAAAFARSSPWIPAVNGARDLLRGALSPASTGADLVAEAVLAVRATPPCAFLGLLFAKLAAWNLLPLPSLNGGAALLDLTVPSGERGNRARAIAAAAGVVVSLAAFVAWIVAIVTWLRR